jgi:hypothetical protein
MKKARRGAHLHSKNPGSAHVHPILALCSRRQSSIFEGAKLDADPLVYFGANERGSADAFLSGSVFRERGPGVWSGLVPTFVFPTGPQNN